VSLGQAFLWPVVGKRRHDPKSGGETEMQRRLLFVVGLLSVLWSASASSATPDAGRFDGRWGVILVCPKTADGALSWSFEFTADVKEGMLHGKHGLAGQPGWLSLDGRIQPDGAASLAARGLTGNPRYNLNQTEGGVPYEHVVTAHFDASRATGNWQLQSNAQVRTCDFTFSRR
jgi:hypothetical protein